MYHKSVKIDKPPRVMFFEILRAFQEPGVEFCVGDIRSVFGLQAPEACARLKALQHWHLIKQVAPVGTPRYYRLTEWGQVYLARQKEKHDALIAERDKQLLELIQNPKSTLNKN